VLAFLRGTVLRPPAAQAQQSDRAWDDCNQSQDLDLMLTGCSEILGRGNRETAANRAFAFNSRGTAHHARSNLDAAIRDYDEAIRLNTRYAEAFSNRGTAHCARGNFDAAIRDYDEAILLDPRDAVTFIKRGNAHRDNDKLDAAMRDYDEAICLSPREAVAFYLRGCVYERRGNLGRAVADFREAIRLGREQARADLDRVEAALAAQQRPPRSGNSSA
jgi:tetratricopeptide (TPR) repeat protein